jgi:hypothetical protein
MLCWKPKSGSDNHAYDSTISLLRNARGGQPPEFMRTLRFWGRVARRAVLKIFRFVVTSEAGVGQDGSTVRYSLWDGTAATW